MFQKTGDLRVLDFDTECRPMHYSEWRPESQITAIAWSWVGEHNVHCYTLCDPGGMWVMLNCFEEAYDEADIVTGHNICRHDLPLLNDHFLREGLPPLSPKLAQDTMRIGAVKGLGKSQENLAVTLGVSAKKHHMAGADWRIANTLADPAGVSTRVIDDVLQHKQLRAALLERGVLKAPRMWRP